MLVLFIVTLFLHQTGEAKLKGLCRKNYTSLKVQSSHGWGKESRHEHSSGTRSRINNCKASKF